MAINKRKILQSAQKHLQKGALEKALKDYKTLLEADPKDANVRLKVGDIYLRQGDTDAAINAYLKVADRFMADGFDAKAVALFKQITKVDPKRYDVYMPLADLYQRLGLNSDAMKALQTAADARYREGDKQGALELLRKMAHMDPTNTSNRLRVAELLRQEGMQDDAIAEYDEVAKELERQGELEGRVSVLQKIVELAPTRSDALESLGRAYVEQRKFTQAEEAAKKLVDSVPGAVGGYEILADAYRGLGRESELPEVYRGIAEILKERGDEEGARDIYQRYVHGASFAAETQGDDAPVLETDDDLSFEAEGADGLDAAFGTDSGLRLGDPIDGSGSEAPPPPEPSPANTLPPLPPLDEEPAAPAEAPAVEGDPEQLVAEASVYLRYGKHERALESLRAVVAQLPGHRGALEKLGEALEASGDVPSAARSYAQAAASAHADGDPAAFAALRERAASLDAGAVAELPEPGAPTAGPAGDEFGSVDFELSTGDASEAAADPEASALAEAGGEIEIDLDLDDAIEPSAGADASSDAPDAAAAEPGGAPAGAADDATETGPGVSTATAQQIADDLEEADFYFNQGLYDAAEGVYKRILEAAPNHPQAMLRMGEIEANRLGGGEAAAAPEAPAPADEDDLDAATRELPREAASAELPSEAASGETPDLSLDEPDPDLDLDGDASFDVLDGEEPDESSVTRGDEGLVDLEAPAEASPDDAGGIEIELGIDGDEDAAAGPSDLAPDEGEMEISLELSDDGELEASDEVLPDDTPAMDLSQELDAGDEGLSLEAGEDEPPAVEPPRVEAEETAPITDAPLDADAQSVEALSAEPEEPSAEPEGLSAEPEDLAAEAEVPSAEPEAQPVQAGAAAAEATPDERPPFDLAAELDHDDTAPVAAPLEGTQEEGFEQVFAAFKRGVEREVDEGDHGTHFDLGIAYKEMGLLEDAIQEFRVALGGAERRLDSLHMMGLCALDLDRAGDAVAHLEQALSIEGVEGELELALRFDLGRAYEAGGEIERARETFQAVADVDAGFQDVTARIEALDRGAPSVDADGGLFAEEEAEGEVFESFDDLMTETEAAPEPAAPARPQESYECFEDLLDDEEAASAPEASALGDDEDGEEVVAEAVVELAPAEAIDEPEPEPEAGAAEPIDAELEPADEAPPEEPSDEPAPAPKKTARRKKAPRKPGGRGKKKISFV